MLEPNVLLIKPSSSVFLKSERTRLYFLKKLRENIKCALNRNNIEFERLVFARLRMFLYSKDLESCARTLQKVFGLHAVALAYELKFSELEEIVEKAVSFFEGRFHKHDSFAVDCSRTGLHYFSSQEVERKLGAKIVMKHGLKVNLKNPDKTLHVEIHNDKAYIYVDEVKCFGGLPTGVEGCVAMLFYGKEEELAASWLLLRKGCNIFPIVKGDEKKVKELTELLIPWNAYRKFILSKEEELEELIDKYNIIALATADTETTREAFANYKEFDSKKELVVLRPLLFYDKSMLEELVRKVKNQ
jgi:thiamine biosynthesis protein ThiI